MAISLDKTETGDTPLARVLAAIEAGDLAPGARLRETDLAEKLGVSRTPVREALHRLHAMGLAEPGPQRGLVVSHLRYDQTRQLFAVREGLEGMAARLAAEHASRSEVSVLEEMVDADRGVSDPSILSRTNKLLHKQIVRASHNTYMTDALENLRIHLSLLPGSTYALPERIAAAQEQHEAIVQAIGAGDGVKAEEAARDHVRSSYKTRLSKLSHEL